ncbi:MAG: hypothetical protein Q7T82_05530 [Armatimonadota bacterium]|nr:hypothetical protein [Armatimonadota bacterium]
MSGLAWKRNAEEFIERRRRFFGREMLNSVLVTLPVQLEVESQWQAFEERWGQYGEGDTRPFPSHEEVFERITIGQQERGQVEDDYLPVLYSILDAGESMVGGMYGGDIRFIHRPRDAAFSHTPPVLTDYADLSQLPDPMASLWTKRLMDLLLYCDQGAEGRFAQHPLITMDALNFAAEMRGATQAYLDVYEHPDELMSLMRIGIDYNIRFQEAQMAIAGGYGDGSFVMMAGWAPFPRAILLSVDAYTICGVDTYVRFGFDFQARLIEHFGHGLMHFHCNRTDLAAEVAKLPGLRMFQFGGDTRDPVPEVEHVPAMRKVVGDIPIMVACDLGYFVTRLRDGTLFPNVWYVVDGGALTVDEANRMMDEVRRYRSG